MNPGEERVELPASTGTVSSRGSTPVGTADLGSALETRLGAPAVPGNRIELLLNGDEFFPAMLQAIRSATDAVDLLTYVYWEGAIAERFAEELARAAGGGVPVRVLVDAYGARRMPGRVVETLESAGCRVAWFHPLHWYTLHRLNNRTHCRALVVDGRVGFTGGAGIGREWTDGGRDPEGWRDNHFRVQGPVLHHLQAVFDEHWEAATGEPPVGRSSSPEGLEVGSVLAYPLATDPDGAGSEIALLYRLFLQAAREAIHISTPYFVPDPSVTEAIAAAAERGVEVKLLLAGEHIDFPLVRYAGRVHYPSLLESGVRIFEYVPTMMHAKAVTVDGRWAIIGTSNFDYRSFELNYEIALAVTGGDLVGALDAAFVNDLARAREITPETVRGWSIPARVRDRAAHLLRRQL